MSVLALLQPALFILSQMDLGPLASAQYFGGFISADFSQTLLSLKLKCLHSFSKFYKCQLLPVTVRIGPFVALLPVVFPPGQCDAANPKQR